MKAATLLTLSSSLLAGGLVSAVPLDLKQDNVVWVTQYETITTTIEITITIQPGETGIPGAFYDKPAESTPEARSPEVPSLESLPEPKPEPQPEPTPAPLSSPPTPVEETYKAAELPAAPAPAPAPAPVPEVPPPPPVTPPPQQQVEVAAEPKDLLPVPASLPVQLPAVNYQPAPAPQSPPPAQLASEPQSQTQSVTGSRHVGEATWWEVGLGACGWTNTSSEPVVAISKDVFDKYTPNGNPNKNPLCGETITIKRNGQEYPCKIVDRCTGCKPGDLDLSHDFFNLVTNNGDGRVSGVEWFFEFP